MSKCRDCGNKGWVVVVFIDFNGYTVPSPKVPCDCGFGKRWERKEDQT